MVRTELALFFRYLVFSDPPGAKIGCGGATMYVLEALEEAIPKEELDKGMVMNSLAWPDPILYRGKGSGTWPLSSLSPRTVECLPITVQLFSATSLDLLLPLP